MSKHTAGPWELREHPHDDDFFVEAKNHGYKMAYDVDVCGEDYTGFGGDEQRRANYTLIAAAPELLEALESMVKMYEELQPSGGYQGVYEESVAALKKARGES